MTIPFIMVTALAIYGWVVLDDIEAKKPNELRGERDRPAVRLALRVPGRRRSSPTELVLPKDRPVDFKIRSDDVIHSFWVPEFRLKSDAVPGLTTTIRLTPDTIDKLPRGLRRAVRHRPLDHAPAGAGRARRRVRRLGRRIASAAPRAAAARSRPPPTARRSSPRTGCDACHTLADADADRRRRAEPRRAGRRRRRRAAGHRGRGLRRGVDRRPERVRGRGLPGQPDADGLRRPALAGGDRRARAIPSRSQADDARRHASPLPAGTAPPSRR